MASPYVGALLIISYFWSRAKIDLREGGSIKPEQHVREGISDLDLILSNVTRGKLKKEQILAVSAEDKSFSLSLFLSSGKVLASSLDFLLRFHCHPEFSALKIPFQAQGY